MEENRRWKRTAAAAAALALVLGVTALYQGTLARSFRTRLEYVSQQAMGQLAESTAAIAVDLEKACCTGSSLPALWEVSARLWRECGTAKAALAALPLEECPAATADFLSLVGDYTMALARSQQPAARSRLQELQPFAETLARRTDLLETALLEGELPLASLGYAPAAQAQAASPLPAEPAGSAGQQAFAAMEEGFAGLPRLVYDGPLSAHLQETAPAMTQNRPHVSRSRAALTAAAAMGCSAEVLEECPDLGGSLPAYRFAHGQQTAAVTKQGGFLLELTCGGTHGAPTLTVEEAETAAAAFLQRMGLQGMERRGHLISQGVCVFEFAALQDGVTCYTDLAKVGVALDSGRVVQADTRSWLNSHRERTFAAPSLSSAEAAALLSPLLEVQRQSLALIPGPGQRERLCFEFVCRSPKGRQVLVYLNAADGAQEELLLAEETEAGLLTL